MEQLFGLFQKLIAWYLGNGLSDIIVHSQALLAGLIVFFMIIPGEQPEKFLQKLVDLLSKYSKK